ncbi:MAG: hypothetical protein E7098_02330 [Mediterranea massiliensis]|nr:hypothetical protein [Mediterranea massiliensis]
MEKRRNMTPSHISAKLNSYLKKHKKELIYATTKFVADDVINFNVLMEEDYSGKDYYNFNGKIEIENPKNDRITEWILIKGKVYIEEGEGNEPSFSKVDMIYPY